MGFKWRLNVETLSHSLMSTGKEFHQMDGAATEKAKKSGEAHRQRAARSFARPQFGGKTDISHSCSVPL